MLLTTTSSRSPLALGAGAGERLGRGWRAFRSWSGRRPFVGAVLTSLAGVELFFSGQLDLGNIHVQLGIEGFQATLIPALLVVLGLLELFAPAQRLFYGIVSLVLAVYSLVGVNLGGFFIGMLLGAVGGILVVAWQPRRSTVGAAAHHDAGDAPEPPPFVDRPS
jgi:hypothetical protein